MQVKTTRSEQKPQLDFTVKVDGKKIPETYEVASIHTEHRVNRIPSARITLLDGDVAERKFAASDGKLFLPGKQIEVLAGDPAEQLPVFEGMIIGHAVQIHGSDHSELVLEARDVMVRMTIGRHSNYFYDLKDSDIIKQIADRYGLEAELDDTEDTHRTMLQYNVSDWDFIVTRAEANGLLCFVDAGKLVVRAPDDSSDPIVRLSYGGGGEQTVHIYDFSAEMDARDQVMDVHAFAWDAAKQEKVSFAAADPKVKTNGNMEQAELARVIGLEDLVLQHGGFLSPGEMQSWAKSEMLRRHLAKVRGRVVVEGVAGVKPGSLIELQGVGDRFNGEVLATGVDQIISNGAWMTQIQFGLDPTCFVETMPVAAPPAAGILPAVQGLQIALVTALEGDPDGQGRIQVRLPIVDPKEKGAWARVALMDAGAERGAIFLPEIGDEVLVGFLEDDPRQAIVLGMLHSSEKPSPVAAADDNHEKGFVTRSKIKLTFNDEKKSVVIETPGGKKVSLDDDQGLICLEDENGHKVLLDGSGLTFESAGDIHLKASGDMNLEGQNINIKANVQFKAEGAAGAEVSTSATAVLKGALVQIN